MAAHFTAQGYQPRSVNENIDHAKTLFVLAIVGPIVSSLVVANRLFFRFRITGGMGIDDWTIVLATTFLTAQSCSTVAAITFGYGQPIVSISSENAKNALFFFWLLQVLYKLTINTVKLSIISLYGRVFYFHKTIIWICVYSFIAVFCAGLAFTLGTILQCWPISAAWDHSIVNHVCTNTTAFWWSNAIWNIASDIFLIILPAPGVRILNVSHAKKAGLACMFSIGLIVIITAILRFTTLQKAAMRSSFEPLSGTLTSTTWTAAEASLAIICANIPMLRQLFQLCIPSLRSSTTTSVPTSPPPSATHPETELPEWARSQPRGPPAAGGDLTLDDEASTRSLVSQRGQHVVFREPDRVYSGFGNIRRSLSSRTV